MKIGLMQPYFMPYIGYFQLIKNVDRYVVYDDVNYIKGGWINRNNILINGNKSLVTIALNDASCHKLINEITIKDNFKNFLKTIELNYKKTPYYEPSFLLIEKIINYENKNLGTFIFNSIKEIMSYLNVDTEIILSSTIEKDNTLKGKYKVVHICKLLNGDTYINAIGGQSLYDSNEFLSHNITLKFLQCEKIEYKQFKNEFIPNLSMIDVLMFNSPDDINKMLDKYILI